MTERMRMIRARAKIDPNRVLLENVVVKDLRDAAAFEDDTVKNILMQLNRDEDIQEMRKISYMKPQVNGQNFGFGMAKQLKSIEIDFANV